MKALTVRQPWAWAIVFAGKDIENRTWKSKYCYGSTIAIHAGYNLESSDLLPAEVKKLLPEKIDPKRNHRYC